MGFLILDGHLGSQATAKEVRYYKQTVFSKTMNRNLKPYLNFVIIPLITISWLVLAYLLVVYPLNIPWLSLSDYGIMDQTKLIFVLILLSLILVLGMKTIKELGTSKFIDPLISIVGCIIILLFPIDITNTFTRVIHWIGGIMLFIPPFISNYNIKIGFKIKVIFLFYFLIAVVLTGIFKSVIPAELLGFLVLSIWIIK